MSDPLLKRCEDQLNSFKDLVYQLTSATDKTQYDKAIEDRINAILVTIKALSANHSQRNNTFNVTEAQRQHDINTRFDNSTVQDMLWSQFSGLCLDNEKSFSNYYINSLSSSPSWQNESFKLNDPIGTPCNKSKVLNNNYNQNISTRKLIKARAEESQQITLEQPQNPIQPRQPTSGRRKNRRASCVECVFCKNNGQPASFYQSHVLKDPLGRVSCPVLSAYDCPICHNGGGLQAHTIRYCPQNKPSNRLRNALLRSQQLNNNQPILFTK